MRSWPFFLATELREGRDAIFVVFREGTLAKAAVVDERGQVLAGDDFGGETVLDLTSLSPGQATFATFGQTTCLVEKISPQSLPFWDEALNAANKAWAAWLLTMADEGDPSTVARHVLAAEGPFTQPRPLANLTGFWTLTPLNAGLGSLLVFGDDELATEAAALGARAGLKVKLITKRAKEDLMPAFGVGRFVCRLIADWAEVDPASLKAIGLKPGVFVLVTAKLPPAFLAALEATPPGWLGLAGAAADKTLESGLFPGAITSAQKALGLLAAMLENK